MDRDARDRLLTELIITGLTTGLILAIWWLAEMPEWKRQAIISSLMSQVRQGQRDPLSGKQLMTIAEFRRKVSDFSRGDRNE